jgi:hydrogenase maturation protein HypF
MKHVAPARTRRFVPQRLTLSRPFARPVLACGAHLKNAICIGLGNQAWIGPRVGDLETIEACDAFEQAVESMQLHLGVRPEVVAHDLHPDYYSTRYALRLGGACTIGVQHHHAHVASAIAEHEAELGSTRSVLGVAYDGTGYGTDGTSWGSEVLRADRLTFDRVATLRPIALAGGDHAIRQVWRIALAVLEDAYAGHPPLESIPLFRRIDAARVRGVREILNQRLNSPLAHGLGRWFDALGSIALGIETSRGEGDVAVRFNFAADTSIQGVYPFEVDEARTPWEIDLRPLVRAAVEDLARGSSPALISARFHGTIAAATAHVVRAAQRELGALPVVLTGGCFQNALLTGRTLQALAPASRVFVHKRVPPGDAGLALGQALIADAIARRL